VEISQAAGLPGPFPSYNMNRRFTNEAIHGYLQKIGQTQVTKTGIS